MTKVTFTQEAIRDFDATRLGELVKDRALSRGVRTFDVVPIDEVIGRLAANGATVVGELPAPLEVESRYPAPSEREIDELLANVAQTGYASEACDVVEEWLHTRYGVWGAMTAAELEDRARRNVSTEGVPSTASKQLARALDRGRLAVVPVGGLESETFTLEGRTYQAKTPEYVVDVPIAVHGDQAAVIASAVAAGLASIVEPSDA